MKPLYLACSNAKPKFCVYAVSTHQRVQEGTGLTWWYILPSSTAVPTTTPIMNAGSPSNGWSPGGVTSPLSLQNQASPLVAFSTAGLLRQGPPSPNQNPPSLRTMPQSRRQSAHFKPSQNNTQYDAIILAASRAYGVPPQLLKSLLVQESDLRPTMGENHASAAGIAQFTRETAPRWGLRVSGGVDERLIPEKAIPAAARYLAHFYQQALQKGFQGMEAWKQALIAYNAGPARMGRSFEQLPRETQKYITQVPERAMGIRVAGYNA